MGRAGTKFFMRRGEPNQRVMTCASCRPHKFQDSVYGLRNRLMNRRSSDKGYKYRCTVCGAEHT